MASARLSLAMMASKFLLASALPANLGDFDPSQLSVQPNAGGGQSDDCGAGPVSLNANTWNAQNMDSVINNFWDAGVSNPNFDFHQQFSNQYGVDLYCSNSFTNCEGDPSSCSQLKGTTDEKTKGWLGIKAIMSVQDMYLQWEKVASNAADGLSSLLVNFQKTFAPPDKPARQAGRKAGINVIGGFFGGVAAVVAVFDPFGGAVAAGVALVASVGTTFLNDVIDDNINAAGGTDLSITSLADSWAGFKLELLGSIDAAHNATFSNGFAGSVAGPRMRDVLQGGGFAGTTVPQAYESSTGSLQGIVERLMISKLLESTWRDSYNTFMIYIPNVIGDCAKWHTGTGDHDVRRYCGSTGMFLLRNLDPKSKEVGGPPGASNEDVASIGDFNIQLQDLLSSAAEMYLGHGLTSTDISYFLPNIIKTWFSQPDNTIFRQQGMFTLPVCELKSYNWRQSDDASTFSPPCDCLTATDQWGDKFMDVAQDDVKAWINAGCQ